MFLTLTSMFAIVAGIIDHFNPFTNCPLLSAILAGTERGESRAWCILFAHACNF